MSSGGKVPDAWDDDWVEKADVGLHVPFLDNPVHKIQQTTATTPDPTPSVVPSRRNSTGNCGRMRQSTLPLVAPS